MSDEEWVELVGDNHDEWLDNGTVILCRYEDRPVGFEKIGVPIIELRHVPDLVAAARDVAVAYHNPRLKPMEFKAAIDKLTEVLEAANYVVKES